MLQRSEIQSAIPARLDALPWSYLTVSEIFPLEIRAISISLFYAIGTGVGGFLAPAFLGALIETGSRERKSLEAVAEPLSAR